MCDSCGYRWIPCGDQYCRGYRINLEPPGVSGCPECDEQHGGVPDRVVAYWPEAYRALARRLDERKLEAVTDGHGPRVQAGADTAHLFRSGKIPRTT